jgi:RNA polymerase sigma-70 factor (ECF subfamily)
VKAAETPMHSPTVEQSLATDRGMPTPAGELPHAIDVAEIYETHVDFLWRSLQHLGIRDADLEDAIQEVLVVVHRKRQSFDFQCRLTTWLFGICLRIASRHRRRAYFRWERSPEIFPEQVDPRTPEDRLAELRDQDLLRNILSTLSPEHRATFVMFEVEGESCQAIADLFGVPLGTVYSRLHAARKQVEQALLREKRKTQKGDLR